MRPPPRRTVPRRVRPEPDPALPLQREPDRQAPALRRTGPSDIVRLQSVAGNSAVSGWLRPPPVVLRDPQPGTTAPVADEATTALSEQLDILKETIASVEEIDPAEAARLERTLLLVQFTHPATLADRGAVLDFVAVCDADAAKEETTLAKLGKDREQALRQYPQAFPSAWADELAKRLDIGVDDATLLSAKQQAWQRLVELGGLVPGLVSEHGLPLTLAEVGSLKTFELNPAHAKLSEPDIVRDYAQAALAYRTPAIQAEVVRWWKRVLKGLVESVRSGDETIDPAELDKMTGSRSRLSDFVRAGAAPGEDAFRELDAEVAKLQEIEALTAVISVAAGIKAAGELWRDASGLFQTKLAEADAIIAAWGVTETLKHAFLWMIDHDYVSSEFLLVVQAMLDKWKEILVKLGIILGLQFVPGVDVLVDLYLIWEMGTDVVDALYGLASSFKDAGGAKTVIDLHKGSASLVAALTTAPLRIMLDFFGIKSTLAHLKFKVGQLRDANPALTDRQAAKQVIQEERTGKPAAPTEPAPAGPKPVGKDGQQNFSSCFVPGTAVLTTDGPRAIEEIAVGDLVVAYDTEARRNLPQPVTAVLTRSVPIVLDLEVGDDVITCSPEHPFWVPDDGWTPAGDLSSGTELLTADGTTVRVGRVTSRPSGDWLVHNVTVAGLSTYFVSATSILVHNKSAAARLVNPEIEAAITTAQNEIKSLRARGVEALDRAQTMPKGDQAPIKAELDEIIEGFHNLQDIVVDAESVEGIQALDDWKADLTKRLNAVEAKVPARPVAPGATHPEPGHDPAPAEPAGPLRLEDINPVDKGHWPDEAWRGPHKERIPRLSGAEAATDLPSWAEGSVPRVGESREAFARRLMGYRYPGVPENVIPKGARSEWSKLEKFARGFRDPVAP